MKRERTAQTKKLRGLIAAAQKADIVKRLKKIGYK